MKSKIWAIVVIAVFFLLALSFTTAVSSNTVKSTEKKESPLYKIRTRQAIGEKIVEIIKDIKAKFLGERIFFINFRPIQWLFDLDDIPVNYRGIPCTKWCGPSSYTSCPS